MNRDKEWPLHGSLARIGAVGKSNRKICALFLVSFLVLLILAGTKSGGFLSMVGRGTDGCLDRPRTEVRSCHQAAMLEIFQKEGVSAAVQYAQTATEGVQTSGECHLLMHALGEAAYEQTPDIKKLLALNFGYCTGGLLHGALEAYFIDQGNMDSFGTEALSVCEEFTKEGQTARSWECLHGVGHALMYLYSNEIFESIRQCDLMPEQWERNVCYFGAFMENSYQHAGAGYVGPPIKFIDPNDPLYPCTAVDGKYKPLCYFFPGNNYMWDTMSSKGIVFSQLTSEDYERAFDVCNSIIGEQSYRYNCIRGLTVYMYISYPSDDERMLATCALLDSPTQRKACFIHLAKTMYRYDVKNAGTGEAFCRIIPSEFRQECLSAIGNWWYKSVDK